jgi:hypothetical protein
MIEEGAVADGVTDDWTVFNDARMKAGSKGIVHFAARLGSSSTVYRLISGTSLVGTQLSADPSVIIEMNPSADIKLWKLLTPLTVKNTAHVTTLTKVAVSQETLAVAAAANVQPQTLNLRTIDFRTWERIGSTSQNNANVGTFTLRSTVTAAEAKWATPFDPGVAYEGIVTPYEIGQYYEALVETSFSGSNQRASIIALGPAAIHAAFGFATGSTSGSFVGSSAFGKSGPSIPNLARYALPVSTGGVTLGFRMTSARDIEYYSNG